MHILSWCTLALTFLNFHLHTSHALRQLRPVESRRFLLLRTNTINQRACKCPTSFSCSCCETVTLSFRKMRKALCSNFMYQRNGLNVDVSLDTDTLRSLTVTNYRPFKVCTAIPDSLFSSICVNVVELNEFPRSITICIRHEILSKFQEWQINYTCVSISTELPMVPGNASMTSTMSMGEMIPMSSDSEMAESTSMTPQTSTMSEMMVTTADPMMTSPAGMEMEMMMTTTTVPNEMESSPSDQTGAMTEGETATSMMPEQRKRKKRYSQIKPRFNYRSKIVNDKFLPQPLELDSSIRPTSTAIHKKLVTIPEVPTFVVLSGQTVANMKATIAGDATIDYNEKPENFEQTGLYDRSAYFPSRIPPVVAMTLKQENMINPGRDDTLFITEYNSQSGKNNTGNLIFPN